MRKVIYGAACSLDGFIAGEDGTLDWLHFSADVQEIMTQTLRGVDTFLMGRITWEVAMAQQGGAPPDAAAEANAGPRTYVFSRTLRPEDAPAGVTLVVEDAGGFVRRLKAQPGGDICLMGGGLLAQSLLEAGVVDEVGLNIHPVLLGRGVPLFRDPGRRVSLALLESRVLDGGCVFATYRVTPSAAPA
jgi:dihydrofolate reductase